MIELNVRVYHDGHEEKATFSVMEGEYNPPFTSNEIGLALYQLELVKRELLKMGDENTITIEDGDEE